VAAYTDELEHCVRNDYTEDEFISRLKGERIPLDSEDLHKTLYRQVLKLKKQNQNDIWARIIKNSFAPLFTERVDYVIGNPPWIRWENLPEDYRESSKHLWERYNLLTQTGWKAKVAAGKVDIAILFVYVAIDSYLQSAGRLGFLITQTVFKSEGGGEGFRAFQFGNGRTFAVEHVDDLSEFQVFEGATNRTAVLCVKNSGKTVYPVKYAIWVSKGPKRLSQDATLSEVQAGISIKHKKASPSISNDPLSPWLTLPEETPDSVLKVTGRSFYRAREGVNTGGANGVFWLASVKKTEDGLLITNAYNIGKNKVPERTGVVEASLVYPLLRGRDIERWRAAPTLNILLTHSSSKPKEAIIESEFKQNFPKAYRFLNHFKIFLKGRPEYERWGQKGPFYELYRIGNYTFADYSVVWPEVGHTVAAAVIGKISTEYGSNKFIIPDHTCILVPTNHHEEANFLAALLNSTPAQVILRGYVTLHPSPHVLEHIEIPKFDPKAKIHQSLAELSLQAHQLRAKATESEFSSVEQKIDEAAAELWGISRKELEQIQTALNEG